MKRIISILSLCISIVSTAQTIGLHPGECGIRFTYDAAGNLTNRVFICNNTNSVMNKVADSSAMNKIGDVAATNRDEIIKVDAIMPNPTTGKFTVRLSQSLNNANVYLSDVNGRVIEKRRQSGNTISYDVSSQPAGMYFVRIEYEGKAVTFKVIKQ